MANLTSALTSSNLLQLPKFTSFTTEVWSCLIITLLLATVIFFMTRSRKIYLVDFACYKPEPRLICTPETFQEQTTLYGNFSPENLKFQKITLERSGLGPSTYLPPALLRQPPNICVAEAMKEAEMVIFGAVDELLLKTGVKPEDIKIVVVNCTLFNPSPSLSSMIVNRYKLKNNVLTYNFSGMGCSAGILSVSLAKHLLQVHSNSYALVVSTENITQNVYFGSERSMLLTNCVFRVGGVAVLLSNRPSDRSSAKYQLLHTVHTNTASDDLSYNCIFREDDSEGHVGVTITKDLMTVARNAIKTNITQLGPLVFPLSEQVIFVASLIGRKLFRMKMKPYIPDIKRTFEHLFPHLGGKPVLDGLQKSLALEETYMEPSRMTLYRFGNTSSSSVWYETAYSEAKGKIKKGDRVWQIVFGSGFKCSSAVWCALRSIEAAGERNPWTSEIHNFPVSLDDSQQKVGPFPYHFDSMK